MNERPSPPFLFVYSLRPLRLCGKIGSVERTFGGAMAKARVKYVCQQCEAEQTAYLGRCPVCNAWGSLVEVVERAAPASARESAAQRLGARAGVERLASVQERRIGARHRADRRVQPRARRRAGARLGRPLRRRSRHRQEHAAARRGRQDAGGGLAGALRLGRGVAASGQAARRPDGRAERTHLHPAGDGHRRRHRSGRPAAAGPGDRRQHPDRLGRGDRPPRPAASPRCARARRG